jgi:heme-degrading monooxygenase HmoA
MICCSFVFQPGEYDDEFHRLDGLIDAFAKNLPGYVRVDRWVSFNGQTRNSMYYFTDMDAVRQLARFPEHVVAKSQVNRWYKAFRVETFELKNTYGKADIEIT